VADAPAAADPAQTAALQAVMARVLAELGRRGSDNGLLDEALAVADTVLASPHADQHLALWLEAQRARALALLWLGARDVDDHRLQAAIAAFQLALHRLPADGAPDEWAWLRQQCGTAMSIAASHARGTAAREAAIAFHRETLARLSVADQPVEWAGVQNLLGIDLNFLSNAQTDHPAERERLLREAIQAFACQLDVLQRDTQPQRWANTQHNLAMGLANLGDCLRDPAPMHDAASRFREVLTVLTLAVYPSAHASVQNELAFALARAADLDPDADRRRWLLDEALAAIQVALDVRQRDRMPVEWARSQCDLGMVRVLQSRHAPDAATARLRADEARIALDEVLAAVAEADEPDLVERARDWRAQSLALLAAPPGSPPA
jgi:tetratricopeptide (TPR) repeat protein